MKICNTCHEEKPLEAFSMRKNGSHVARCKACHNAYVRQNYANNREKYAEKNRRDGPKYRERNRRYMTDYLRTHPCVDCGETDIEVLEFDHIIPLSGKRVTNMNGTSLAKLQEEIDRCEVRCANCHTRRTRRQMGWSRG